MKGIITYSNPEYNWPMYISEISFERYPDKTAAISYKSTSNKEQAMVFTDKEELKLAMVMINIHNQKHHFNCNYTSLYKCDMELL